MHASRVDLCDDSVRRRVRPRAINCSAPGEALRWTRGVGTRTLAGDGALEPGCRPLAGPREYVSSFWQGISGRRHDRHREGRSRADRERTGRGDCRALG
jgi:hypothetical protein